MLSEGDILLRNLIVLGLIHAIFSDLHLWELHLYILRCEMECLGSALTTPAIQLLHPSHLLVLSVLRLEILNLPL